MRPQWLVLSNAALPAFARVGPAGRAPVFRYAGGLDVPAEGDFTFDVDLAQVGPVPPDHGSITVTGDGVVVRSSAQNVTPVYAATISGTGQFVLGTDLVTTAVAYAQLTHEPLALRPESGIRPDSRSPVIGVDRVEAARTLLARPNSDGGWTVRLDEDPVALAAESPVIEDPLDAGLAQIAVLRIAIERAAGRSGGISALVSGGVDSSLVAALAHELGVDVSLYSIGTPWGDEFEPAEELARALGRPLHRVHLSADEIVGALPATIRMLGHTEPESVDISVALTAFFQLGRPEHPLVVTGYGSDLINSGMATGADIDGDVAGRIRDAVHRTGYSSEFSGAAARAAGYTVAHPYWDPAVIRVALATGSAARTARHREKGHLRLAAQTLLPPEVAWRPKTAIHHGNGIGRRLGARIDADTSVPGSKTATYRAILAELLRGAANDVEAIPSGLDLYARAVEVVHGGHNLGVGHDEFANSL